ncbi:MAG TPA: heavy metal-associated domain-containing protein [Armatimonadota bacterium]|jgi:copper chaperone CopZ
MRVRALAVLVLGASLVFAGAANAKSSKHSEKQAKGATQVATLQVDGMHCAGCQGAVQSALSHTKGVKDADVSLKDNEAKVTYDPRKTNTKKLVAAVDHAKGMAKYHATLKKS